MKSSLAYRNRLVQIFFGLATLVLLLKAFQLQIVDDSYKARARAIAIDKYVKYPSRGLILDRNHKLLVNNNAMYDLMVTYNQVDENMDIELFCELLRITPEEFAERLNKNWRDARYSKRIPFVFLKKISAWTYARFQEHMFQFPGFFVRLRNVRAYPHKNASHVLGYISEVSQSQIDRSKGKYIRGDYIGASGLEQAYEERLRGRRGVEYLLKDNLGRVVGSYKNGELDTAAVSGQDLVSSLDLDLQAYSELLMKNKKGSIVAIEPKSGEILAMISSPSYNPNLLTINRYRGQEFNKLLSDSINKPFFDRSLMAKYPPGSIFKTVVSLVGLQEGVLKPNTYVPCSGAYYYKSLRRGCHNHPPAYGVQTALQHSCNSYYFQTLRDLVDKYGFTNPSVGLDTFVNYLKEFGLGQRLDVDIPNEVSGNVPGSAYYNFLYPADKGGWRSPTIMSIGIGQGEIEMTTLQMANLAATIANRGFFYRPHLLKGIRGGEPIDAKYREVNRVSINPAYFDPIVDGMEKVIMAGTGRIARVPGVAVCGKTGTSQNPHGKDHSVFFAFAPKDDPQIALAVYVENGGYGATYAAPITGLIIEKYLKGEIDESKKRLEEKMLKADLLKLP